MEATTTERAEPTALVRSSKWSDFNGRNEYAELEFIATPTQDDLPAEIRAAITTVGLSKSNLGTQEVNWTIRCVSKDGKTALTSASKVYSGDKSSTTGCGEVGMWFNEASNVKDAKRPRASAEFRFLHAIYVINAGLCPCKRCAFSLLNLAKELKSTIIVSPQTDYDYLDANASRVDVTGDVYFHVYDATKTKVQVYCSRPKPAHLEEVAVVQKALAPFKCVKSNHEVLVLFPSISDMTQALKPPTGKEAKSSSAMVIGPVYNCPVCKHLKTELRYDAAGKQGRQPEFKVSELTPFVFKQAFKK
jgi:hypothetical protein